MAAFVCLYETLLGSCYKEHLQSTALRQEEFVGRWGHEAWSWGPGEAGQGWGVMWKKRILERSKNQENTAEGHREDGNLAVLPTSSTEDLCPGDTDR